MVFKVELSNFIEWLLTIEANKSGFVSLFFNYLLISNIAFNAFKAGILTSSGT